MMIRVHSIAYPVYSLGPGPRIALWVSGCKRNCDGCISPELQDPESGRLIETDVLLRHLYKIDFQIKGITISGGEPIDQKEALAHLLDHLKAVKPEWSLMVYSGFTLKEIEVMGKQARPCLDLIDVLLDGHYDRSIPSNHPLLGSGNQKIHYLSPKGLMLKPLIEREGDEMLEMGLGPSGFQMLIGVGSSPNRSSIIKGLFQNS